MNIWVVQWRRQNCDLFLVLLLLDWSYMILKNSHTKQLMHFSVLFCKVVLLNVIFLATHGNNNLQWQKIFLNALVETESTHGLDSGWNSAGLLQHLHRKKTPLCADFHQFHMLHNSASNWSPFLVEHWFFFFPTGLLTRGKKDKVSNITSLKLWKCLLRINTKNEHNAWNLNHTELDVITSDSWNACALLYDAIK